MKRSPRPRAAVNLCESVNQQLNMYVLAASAAGVSLLAFAPLSEAKIVYAKAHVVLGARSNTHYNLDLNHDGVVDFALSHAYLTTSTHGGNQSFVSNVFVPYNTGVNRLNAVVAGSGVDYASALRAGIKVGRSNKFGREGFMAGAVGMLHRPPLSYGGAWANGGKGLQNRYLGLRFVIKGKVHFGWARVSVSKWPFVVTLTGYAYETIPNKPIIAGKTKGPDVVTVQPASLGHLATGASAIPAWRVKQTAAEHADVPQVVSDPYLSLRISLPNAS
jgi:hypothetical protein